MKPGAACVLDRSALLGQLFERADDWFGKVTGVEENRGAKDPWEAGDMVAVRGQFTLGGPDFARWLTPGELLNAAYLLGRSFEVEPVGWRSCLRCRRLNAGPCISATCLDLQVCYPSAVITTDRR